MHLHPFSVVYLTSVLSVEPADVAACAEARRVNREISLYRLQGQATGGDEFRQYAGKLRVGNVAIDRVEVRPTVYESVGIGFPQITCKASAREPAVDLIDGCEQHIRERQARPSLTFL